MINKKGQVGSFVMDCVVAIIGLFMIFQLNKAFCEADAGFCNMGIKFLSFVMLGVYFIVKYGLVNRR